MKPKDFKTDDWLEWFAEDDWPIFRLADGRRAATDGRTAVVTSQDGLVGEQRRQNIVEKLLKLLEEKLVHEVFMTRDEVLVMFGECRHPELVKCSACNGTKKVTHQCDCELCTATMEDCANCEATGIVEKSNTDRIVLLWNTPFDANKIAYVVEHSTPSESYKVGISDIGVHIVSDIWHAVICKMADEVKRQQECPELMLAAKE